MMITFNRLNSLRRAGALVCAAMLATAAFTACDKKDPVTEPTVGGQTEAVSEKPMSFRTTSAMTKAEGDATTLPEGSSFGVFAFYQAGVIGSSAGTWDGGSWNPAFMFNQEVTYSGGDSTVGTNYPYTPMKYWPYNEENTISFWAYYPYSASPVIFAADGTSEYSRTATGLGKIQFTVDGTTDFMTSDLKKDESRPGATPNTPVNLLFHHRLSSVRFMAKTDKDYTGERPEGTTGPWPIAFQIKKVELLNDYTTGVLTQTVGTGDADDIAWSGYDSENTARTFFDGSQTVTATDAVDCGDALLLLPQPMDHGTNKVSVKITYTQQSGNNDVETKEAVVELDAESIGIAAWADNQQYIYTITLAYNALYINPTIADWVDADELEYTLKMNTNMRLFDSWLYRYDTVDQDYSNWTNWAGSHMAVSEGRVTETSATEPVAGRPLRSPQIQLVTTGVNDFDLVIDNNDFEIVRANKNATGVVTGYESSTDGKLNIAAGDDVYTYFYIVPKDGVTPSNPVAKVSLIYNDSVTGPQKVAFNYNTLPGYSDDSSEIWAYYFPADEYNITGKLKMYFQDYNNPLVPTAVQN